MFDPTLKMLASLSLLSLLPTSVAAEINRYQETDEALEEIAVVAGRIDSKATDSAYVIRQSNMQQMAAFRLDDMLIAVPGASLFRRANSQTAHPTIQGLALMPVGGNAAGRAQVTLDGVPLNDPFGGWVYWSALDATVLDRMEAQIGGAGGALAANALTGRLQLHSRSDSDYLQTSGFFGSDNQWSLGAAAAQQSGETTIAASSRYFQTDGDAFYAPDQAGLVDVAAASDAFHVKASLAHVFNERMTVFAGISRFKEDRINGYALAPNETNATDYTFRAAYNGEDWAAEWINWYKDRDFQNIFVAARDNRTTARQVLDQFDVPAWGYGSILRMSNGPLEFGVDLSRRRGAVYENYRNLGGGFTRTRHAGGDQRIIGSFGAARLDLKEGHTVTLDLRLDKYRVFNGERQERDLATKALVRNEQYADVSGLLPTGAIGYSREVGAWTIGAKLSKSWRLPTLNEYYRPFRVGNDITEANGSLTPEKLITGEIAASYDAQEFMLDIAFFKSWLRDGVGNITIGFGPGFYPLGGFVPGGGVLRQRFNIEESESKGMRAGASWTKGNWQAKVRYLYTQATITKASLAAEVIGNQPIQTPKHQLYSSLSYTRPKTWVTGEMQANSYQFDDDLNRRRLDGYMLANISAGYYVMDGVALRFDITNVFDSNVISALSGDGLETLALRRSWRLGFSADF